MEVEAFPLRTRRTALLDCDFSGGSDGKPYSGITDLRLGNGLWENTIFNDGLQPRYVRLGTTAGAFSVWQLQNGLGGTVNNGNVLTRIVTTPNTTGQSVSLQQDFQYDGLNRPATSRETWSRPRTGPRTNPPTTPKTGR